jgi:hypothetical protein
MRRRLIRIALILLLLPPLLSAVAGLARRSRVPHPIREADASFAVTHSFRRDFDVHAPDGVLLRGWRLAKYWYCKST